MRREARKHCKRSLRRRPPTAALTALFWNAEMFASVTVANVYTEKKNPNPPNHHASPSHLEMCGASKSSVVSAATPSSQINSCSYVFIVRVRKKGGEGDAEGGTGQQRRKVVGFDANKRHSVTIWTPRRVARVELWKYESLGLAPHTHLMKRTLRR